MTVEKNIVIELIIHGNDVESSSTLNEAIIESFTIGIISSTTMMNMSGFEQACNLIYENKLLDFVGIHFNLIQEFPLVSVFVQNNKKLNKSICNAPLSLVLVNPAGNTLSK